MPTAKVTNVRKIGQWEGQHGTMYTQEVVLDNGITGQANSKDPVPWYKIGDEVVYEQNGEYQGIPKLKISKPDGGFSGGGGFKGKPKDSTGMRVGMAMNNAVLLACHGKIEIKALEATARRIIQIATKLEEETRPAPAPKQQDLPSNMEPAHPPAKQPEPTPEDSSEDIYGEDEIPF